MSKGRCPASIIGSPAASGFGDRRRGFVDFPAATTVRIQADRAFTAAGLERTVAFEIDDLRVMARLVAERLGVALLPSTYAARLPAAAAAFIDRILATSAPS